MMDDSRELKRLYSEFTTRPGAVAKRSRWVMKFSEELDREIIRAFQIFASLQVYSHVEYWGEDTKERIEKAKDDFKEYIFDSIALSKTCGETTKLQVLQLHLSYTGRLRHELFIEKMETFLCHVTRTALRVELERHSMTTDPDDDLWIRCGLMNFHKGPPERILRLSYHALRGFFERLMHGMQRLITTRAREAAERMREGIVDDEYYRRTGAKIDEDTKTAIEDLRNHCQMLQKYAGDWIPSIEKTTQGEANRSQSTRVDPYQHSFDIFEKMYDKYREYVRREVRSLDRKRFPEPSITFTERLQKQRKSGDRYLLEFLDEMRIHSSDVL